MNAYKDNFKLIDWSANLDKTAKVVEHIEDKRSHLSAPTVFGDYAPYECPVTGGVIEGRRAHSENLKQTGCRILERGEFEDNRKNGKQYAQQRMDTAIDKAVDEVAKEFI